MQITALTLISLSAAFIFYEDVTRRYISFISILVLFAGCILYNIASLPYFGEIFLINIGFLFFFLGFLKLYFSIKNQKNEKLINRYIGLGDVLLLLCLCFSYTLNNYIIVILLSCVVSIMFWFVNMLRRRTVIRIPLAGVLSLVHLIVIIYCTFTSLNPIVYNFFFVF